MKAAARAAALARRAGADRAGQGRALAHLGRVLAAYPGKVLSGYVAMRDEIDPMPALLAHDGPLCLPVVPGRGVPLLFREWRPGAPLVPGGFGTRVPEAGADLLPEVLVVPLLAFDRRGYRLGYGGGYYDRTLELLRSRGPVTAIGFAWAAQEGEVPVGPFDQRLDMVVTEDGVMGEEAGGQPPAPPAQGGFPPP